jgi:type II secretion system protein N
MKKWIAVTGYIIIITFIFLYYLFPTEAVTAYINYRLTGTMPGLHLEIDQIRPAFPPGVNLRSTRLYRQEKELFGLDRLVIRPKYLTMLSSTKSFSIFSNSYGGEIDGTANLLLKESNLNVDLNLNNIAIDGIPAVSEIIPHTLSGTAVGKLIFSNQPPFGNGQADIVISDCVADFKPALFGMDQLKMDTVTANAVLNDRILKIDNFEIKGREINGRASGTVTLRNPFIQSSINLSGQVTPTPTLMKNLSNLLPIDAITGKNIAGDGIPFRISGTFDNPSFSMR